MKVDFFHRGNFFFSKLSSAFFPATMDVLSGKTQQRLRHTPFLSEVLKLRHLLNFN
jgi:hypothetical protein